MENFLLSQKKPHKPIGTQTLALWIKRCLDESGVDIKKFQAHSTRHASTSTAKRAGVNIDCIRNAAGWSQIRNLCKVL